MGKEILCKSEQLITEKLSLHIKDFLTNLYGFAKAPNSSFIFLWGLRKINGWTLSCFRDYQQRLHNTIALA